jgi:cytochrome P450
LQHNASDPSVEAFDLYSPEIDADPFPYYAILREQYPCYWSESGKLWILSRYDDVMQAARDWETFSSAQGNLIDELPGRSGATLGTTDPPRHDRLRALSQAAFARKNIENLIAPTIEIADLTRFAPTRLSNLSTTSPARSPSACCSASWDFPSGTMPTFAAR